MSYSRVLVRDITHFIFMKVRKKNSSTTIFEVFQFKKYEKDSSRVEKRRKIRLCCGKKLQL